MALVDDFITEMRNIGVICVRQIELPQSAILLLQGQGNKLKATIELPTGIISTADQEDTLSSAVDQAKLQLSQRSGKWPEENPE